MLTLRKLVREQIAKMKVLGEDKVMSLEEAVSTVSNKLPTELSSGMKKTVKEIIADGHVEECPDQAG